VYDGFSYEHVKEALQDDQRLVRKELSRSNMSAPNPFSYIDNAIIWSDGARHSQTKHQLFERFTPDVLRDLQRTIEDLTRMQLDGALEDEQEFDFVTDFAIPVPLRVVMQLVGVPQQDHWQILTWLETFRTVMDKEYGGVESRNPEAMAATVEYFKQLVAEWKADPRDDLISRLVEETDLNDEVIGANCFDFIMAGHTSASARHSRVSRTDRHAYVPRTDRRRRDTRGRDGAKAQGLEARVRATPGLGDPRVTSQ